MEEQKAKDVAKLEARFVIALTMCLALVLHKQCIAWAAVQVSLDDQRCAPQLSTA